MNDDEAFNAAVREEYREQERIAREEMLLATAGIAREPNYLPPSPAAITAMNNWVRDRDNQPLTHAQRIWNMTQIEREAYLRFDSPEIAYQWEFEFRNQAGDHRCWRSDTFTFIGAHSRRPIMNGAAFRNWSRDLEESDETYRLIRISPIQLPELEPNQTEVTYRTPEAPRRRRRQPGEEGWVEEPVINPVNPAIFREEIRTTLHGVAGNYVTPAGTVDDYMIRDHIPEELRPSHRGIDGNGPPQVTKDGDDIIISHE